VDLYNKENLILMLTYSKIQWSTQDTTISENSDLLLFYFYFVLQHNTNASFNIQDAAVIIFSIITATY